MSRDVLTQGKIIKLGYLTSFAKIFTSYAIFLENSLFFCLKKHFHNRQSLRVKTIG